MVRLFIAVDLPDETRVALAARCQGIAAAKWTRSEQLHVTLRFLGHVDEAELPGLEAALAGVRAVSFSLGVKGLGTFPPATGWKAPRVLWAGLTPREPLVALKAAIDEELGPDEEAASRGFSPHVTLARFDGRPAAAELAAFLAAGSELEGAPFAVDSFQLYRSELGPSGARHTVLARFALGA